MRSRPTLIFCWLLLGIGLSAFATWLQSQYPLPMAGTQLYGITQKSATVIWLPNHGKFDPSQLHLLDLKTGRTSAGNFRTLDDYGQRNSRGQRIHIETPLEIIGDLTGKVLWSGPTPGASRNQLPILVGDHYLVEPLSDQLCVIDLDLLTGTGLTATKPVENVADAKRFHDAPGAMEQPAIGLPSVVAMAGSNRFACHLSGVSGPTVAVYEIENGELIKRSSWPVGTTSIITNGNEIMTASPSGTEVEVRSMENFQVIRSHPLPDGIGSWDDYAQIAVRNGLFFYRDLKSGATRVGRLDDLSSISELNDLYPISRWNLPLACLGVSRLEQKDSRYVLLTNLTLGLLCSRFVVYDTVERRVVLDQSPPVGVQDMNIVDERLVMVNEAMGLTVDVLDLPSGQLKQRFRPFAWVIWTLPVLLLAGLGWLVVWIRLSTEWSRFAAINIAILIALFLTPQVIHFVMFDTYRLTVGYSACVLLVCCFAGCAYAVFGSQRVFIRLVPICLVLAVAMGLANFYAIESGKRGLAALPRLVAEPVRLAIVFSMIACPVLYGLKLVGFRIQRRFIDTAAPTEAKPSMTLGDIFWLTAALAALIAAATPNRAFLSEPKTFVAFAILSLILLPCALLGLLSLIRSNAVYRVVSWVALSLAAFLIGEITMHLALGHRHGEPWYHLTIIVRYLLFLLLTAFTFGSLVRARYTIARAHR